MIVWLLSLRCEANPLEMPLLDLMNELLLLIAENLESERDVNHFSQTNGRLHDVLNTYLYRHNLNDLEVLVYGGLHNMGKRRRLISF